MVKDLNTKNDDMGFGIKSSYNNIILTNEFVHVDDQYEDRYSKSPYLYTPQGHGMGLKTSLVKISTVMFPFGQNYAHPLCCPSTHTTSTGCVCTTPEQESYIFNKRGGNN